MNSTSWRQTNVVHRAILAAYALIFAFTAVAGFGQSQPAPSQPAPASVATTAAEGKVVTLPVTVRDKHGQIVRDLTQDDFILQEDGRPETVKYFSRQADVPLTLGLLVDTSYSQRDVLDQERNASRGFLDQMIVPDRDKAFLIHFDREVELLQDLTSHHDKLASALDLLKSADPDRSDDANSTDSRSGTRYERKGRQLYDSVYLASTEVLKKPQGRKAVIILSDGVDQGSKTTLESAIESAQRTDTVFYTILLSGHEERDERRREGGGMGRGGGYPGGGGWPGGGGGWPGGGGGYPGGGGGGRRGGSPRPSDEPRVDGKKIMERIAKETGGRFFEVKKKDLVGDAYSSIAEELKTQYSLAYTPDKDSSPSGYHHVQLQVKRKDLVVQTRDGYYADREN